MAPQEFIEGILGIRPVTVQLPQAGDLVVGIGDQYRVLAAGDALAGFSIGLDESKNLLTVIFTYDDDFAHQGPAQNDDASLLRPTGQGQFAILAFPSPAGIRPVFLGLLG